MGNEILDTENEEVEQDMSIYLCIYRYKFILGNDIITTGITITKQMADTYVPTIFGQTELIDYKIVKIKNPFYK